MFDDFLLESKVIIKSVIPLIDWSNVFSFLAEKPPRHLILSGCVKISPGNANMFFHCFKHMVGR